MQSGVAGLTAESQRFDLSAERLTRLAGAPSAAETAETVQISAEARQASETRDSVTTSGLERAMVDMRVAKYAFIANLKVLQTGAEVEKEAAKLGK
jgi:flagellar basal body rod protein FlgC